MHTGKHRIAKALEVRCHPMVTIQHHADRECVDDDAKGHMFLAFPEFDGEEFLYLDDRHDASLAQQIVDGHVRIAMIHLNRAKELAALLKVDCTTSGVEGLAVHIVGDDGAVISVSRVVDPRVAYCEVFNRMLEGESKRAEIPYQA